eukprot:TRINITY_DN19743_c0_g1_i4.p1 TRINITY_DN19743_c0_g1~~TRINITY_DN19743_c0_g1_i4.p1  ORF type:complete len:182 (-),score=45.06 TRINITY_DN19743_c0_g1_i4:101-646(-)
MITLYVSSFVLDLFDGMAARHFNQCSSLGGVLDMLTDRCSTAGLLVILTWREHWPQYRLVFLLCIVLDFSSHWCAMYSAAIGGAHHKSAEATKDKFFLMRWYYEVYAFFGYCCVGQEFFYILLFVLAPGHNFNPVVAGVSLSQLCWYGCGPAWALKQIVNVFQLTSSCYSLAEQDIAAKNK